MNADARGVSAMSRFGIGQTFCAGLLAIANLAQAELSRDDAAASAQHLSGGRVLSIHRSEAEGRAQWRTKLLTVGGEVRVLILDAQTGQVVEARHAATGRESKAVPPNVAQLLKW